jgi:hypothetical protein
MSFHANLLILNYLRGKSGRAGQGWTGNYLLSTSRLRTTANNEMFLKYVSLYIAESLPNNIFHMLGQLRNHFLARSKER